MSRSGGQGGKRPYPALPVAMVDDDDVTGGLDTNEAEGQLPNAVSVIRDSASQSAARREPGGRSTAAYPDFSTTVERAATE